MQPSSSHGPPPGVSLPDATLALQAARLAQVLHGKELPRLRELRANCLREADAWCGAALALALQAHLDAVLDLRFDMLVARGLRDAPSRQSVEAFRMQVETVSTCTEVSWLLVRDALAQRSHEDSMEPAALDFVMGSRAIQREVAQAAVSVTQMRERFTNAPDVPATTLVRTRLDEAAQLLAPLELACEALPAVHKAAWHGADVQRGLGVALADLAQMLRGGLLVRLAALIAPDATGAAQDLDAARQARDELAAALRKAASALDAVHAAQDRLLDRLEAMPSG